MAEKGGANPPFFLLSADLYKYGRQYGEFDGEFVRPPASFHDFARDLSWEKRICLLILACDKDQK